MLITRTTRHDKADIKELLDAHGWSESNVDEGMSFIARDGTVVGLVRVIEVEPRTLVFDEVLVREDRREEGIGRRLIRAALNNKGGTCYLCCHEERLAFYGHFGFQPIDIGDAPESVRAYWEKVGDHPTPPGHVHYYLKAR